MQIRKIILAIIIIIALLVDSAASQTGLGKYLQITPVLVGVWLCVFGLGSWKRLLIASLIILVYGMFVWINVGTLFVAITLSLIVIESLEHRVVLLENEIVQILVFVNLWLLTLLIGQKSQFELEWYVINLGVDLILAIGWLWLCKLLQMTNHKSDY